MSILETQRLPDGRTRAEDGGGQTLPFVSTPESKDDDESSRALSWPLTFNLCSPPCPVFVNWGIYLGKKGTGSYPNHGREETRQAWPHPWLECSGAEGEVPLPAGPLSVLWSLGWPSGSGASPWDAYVQLWQTEEAGKSTAFKNTRSSLQRRRHSKGETITAGSRCRHTMSAPELHPLYHERLVRDCSVSCGWVSMVLLSDVHKTELRHYPGWTW